MCDNYRGIAILTVTSKIISRAILNRLNPILDSQTKIIVAFAQIEVVVTKYLT